MSTDKTTPLLELAATHDWDADSATELGTYGCEHFGEWATELFGADPVVIDSSALASNENLRKAGALLQRAGVPSNWVATLNVIASLEEMQEQNQPVRALVAACNRRFAQLLAANQHDHDSALRLAYLFEAEIFLSDWITDDAGDFNYVPRTGMGEWLPRYLAVVDQYLTPEDLEEITRVGEDWISATQALSKNCAVEKIVQSFETETGLTMAAPTLPANLVSEHLDDNPALWFHPNADPEQSWRAIQTLLDDGQGEELPDLLREFDNARDDAWGNVMGYQVTGPHAQFLRDKIKAWCRANPDEGEEIFEELFYDEDFEEEDED